MQSRAGGPRPWWTIMLRDLHWWVPFVVLVGGLVVLRWIR